ncbi:MAG TPA: hypothetical protein VL354_11705, partial [Spirochaetia bacterium]|nr:hypothetical protein [Spirochaetia bacterium]
IVAAGSWPSGASSPQVLAGLTSSWIRVGPLSPSGMLREAGNPMGFQAGSDAFVQRSGLTVSSSLPARSPGILLMPVPQALGVFYQQLAGGGQWMGCLAGVFERPGVSLEGFFSLSEPPPESMGDEWFADTAPFAGGKILSSAARLVFDGQPFGMTVTLGTSLGEMSPPGGFLHLHLCAGTSQLRIFLLLSRADSTYLSPSGDPPRDASSISAALRAGDADGSVDARVSRSVRQPGFSPRPFFADTTEAGFSAEKCVVTSADALLSLRVGARRIIHRNTDGAAVFSSRSSGMASLRVSPFTLESGISCSDSEGFSPSVAAERVFDRHGSLVAFEAAAAHLDAAEPTFSTFASLRLKRKSFHASVTFGLADLGLRESAAGLAKGLRLSLEWGAHSP